MGQRFSRRVSLLAATQDEGAPGPTNSDCSNSAHPVFAVYPSSSPYITAISGTTLTPPSSSDEHMKRDVAQKQLADLPPMLSLRQWNRH
jgi:subtilase family serine protease